MITAVRLFEVYDIVQTIPQSASLTAPFAQGSLGCYRTRTTNRQINSNLFYIKKQTPLEAESV